MSSPESRNKEIRIRVVMPPELLMRLDNVCRGLGVGREKAAAFALLRWLREEERQDEAFALYEKIGESHGEIAGQLTRIENMLLNAGGWFRSGEDTVRFIDFEPCYRRKILLFGISGFLLGLLYAALIVFLSTLGSQEPVGEPVPGNVARPSEIGIPGDVPEAVPRLLYVPSVDPAPAPGGDQGAGEAVSAGQAR